MSRYLMLVLSGLCFSYLNLAMASEKPDCSRAYSLALHDHGLLYSAATDKGIDKDIANELIKRSGCRIDVSVMPRSRIWKLLEAGAQADLAVPAPGPDAVQRRRGQRPAHGR